MKIILSRKGFDSAYGGYPSPILPDNRMISFPIPSNDKISYDQIKFGKNFTYLKLMKQLNPKIKFDGKWLPLTKNTKCHLDPDINLNIIKRPKEWKPLFGQINAAQTHLQNQGVKKNDIFLFFGWFKKTINENNKLLFDPNESNHGIHIIFGYFQIGRIMNILSDTKIPSWIKYHPHTCETRKIIPNNTIYIARDTISWDKKLPGAGFFNYNSDLVLTKHGFSRTKWDLPALFKKVNISYHTEDCWKENYFQSVARGQEFVVEENNKVTKWAMKLINHNIKL